MSERSRSRSYSPDHKSRHSKPLRHHRHRSRSPHHSRRTARDTEDSRQHKSESLKRTIPPKTLPLNARQISKHDLRIFRPMFGLYLDVQKDIYIEDLTEDEVKGRWKSFVGKWNRGELAEGWYDPQTLQKAITAEQGTKDDDRNRDRDRDRQRRVAPSTNHRTGSSGKTTSVMSDAPAEKVQDRNDDKDGEEDNRKGDEDEDDDDDDDFGPAMPQALTQRGGGSRHISRSGPAIPTISDLQAIHEQRNEDAATRRDERIASIRSERKLDRKSQRERLDDLTPRAEAGSREHMLENKRLAADSNRSFAAAAHASGDVDLKDSDVMGDEDSIGDLKRMQKESDRKKNERELRREEILRARMAEREERLKGMREKEDKTMDMLKKIAQARFGGGGS